MIRYLLTLALSLATLSQAFAYDFADDFYSASDAVAAYPIMPNPSMTPGSLCGSRAVLRYPEQIPYCERAVSTQTKELIIRTYDANFGYHITQMDRRLFKVDHYIPLCMGGSNEMGNLWPQHESIFKLTDPLEQLLCSKMSQGRLRQADAINLIRRAKANLNEVRYLYDYALKI